MEKKWGVDEVPFSVTEVQIFPCKLLDGFVGFASCVIDGWLFLAGIAIHAKLTGGIRLVFPTKRLANSTELSLYHPISRRATERLTEIIGKEFFRVLAPVGQSKQNVVKEWPGHEKITP